MTTDHDWTTGPDGRSSSPLFEDMRRDVTAWILDNARNLLYGNASDVAGIILAQLAHVHGLRPATEVQQAPAPAPTGEVTTDGMRTAARRLFDANESALRGKEPGHSWEAAMDWRPDGWLAMGGEALLMASEAVARETAGLREELQRKNDTIRDWEDTYEKLEKLLKEQRERAEKAESALLVLQGEVECQHVEVTVGEPNDTTIAQATKPQPGMNYNPTGMFAGQQPTKPLEHVLTFTARVKPSVCKAAVFGDEHSDSCSVCGVGFEERAEMADTGMCVECDLLAEKKAEDKP